VTAGFPTLVYPHPESRRMTAPLKGRIALVTGASRGIGFAAARALAKAGAHVVAVARTVGGLEELDDAIQKDGGSATLVPLDMKDLDGIARLALALHERYGRLDVLLGNAGILGALSPLPHVEPKVWDDMLAINLTANWQLIRTMDPLLRAAPAGRVVFMSSNAASNCHAYWGVYSACKAALDAMGRTYAAETASTNVKVNLFAPGPTRTKMRAAVMPGEDPMTLPTADEVAAKIVEMCLPDMQASGQLYDFRAGKLLSFQKPA
jgi:NAD(P)-dependent dehydrogenase (short-subunit alcohol dehydrogenase family)